MTAASEVQAVILCGGRGTRLQSVIGDRPKALAEVAGRPFLDWMLDGLKEQGVRNFILCTGFGESAVREHMAANDHGGCRILYSHEVIPLGTGGAVRNALRLMNRGPVLVLNADSWCSYSLAAFLEFNDSKFNDSKGAVGTILLAMTEDRGRYGSVELDCNSRVSAFHEKNSLAGPGLINAGVYALDPDCIGEMPGDRAVSLESEFFPAMVERGLFGWSGGVDFIDIGTPESFSESQRIFGMRRG